MSNDIWFALLLTLLAGLSTGIGSGLAYFIHEPKPRFMTLILGFSAGVMLYVSFAELLHTAFEQIGYLTSNIAFFIGIAFIGLIDMIVPHEYKQEHASDAALSLDKDSAGLKVRGHHGFQHGAPKYKNLKRAGIISNLGHRYPRQLSAGQQQRVALARAIAPEPEVLLLDEPFSALDAQVKERLELELMNLQNFYKGNILFVTHNLAEGFKVASKIAVYESGHIVQCDNKNKVIACPANRTVARLTGVRNLLRGTIAETKDLSATVQVPELGGTVRVTGGDITGLTVNQNVTIGIRPEFIHIADDPGENAFSCTADRIVENISLVECFFHVNTAMASQHWVEVSLPKLHAPCVQEGHKCYVFLPPEHIAIIRD